MHAARGHALAGLGRHDEALAEAQWLRDSREYRDDLFQGTIVGEDRAAILAAAGDVAGAVDELSRLLAAPSWISVPLLRRDFRWDPIRAAPRFRQLLTDGSTQTP